MAAIAVCLLLVLTGCGTMQADITKTGSGREESHTADNRHLKTEGWRIQDGCEHLSEDMAREIYEKILTMQQETYQGIQKVENSRMVFLDEEKNGRKVTVRAVFEADWTGIRKPGDHPMIQGMYKARDGLATAKEKKAADEYIQGWLAELEPQYQETQRVPWQIVVQFQETDTEGYRLYYPFVQESKETLVPLEQYVQEHCKEDAKEQRKIGKRALVENVQTDRSM